MQKLAQTRGIVNKLKEYANIPAESAEKYFSGEFLKVMQSLRSADNDIRSVIMGKPIDGGTPGRDPASIKQLLKDTKTNLNRREYMAAIADLGRFHAKFIEVSNLIYGLSRNVDKVHHDFLFKDLKEKHERGEDDRFEHLKQLKKRLANPENYIVKEAGIMDFFHNIGTRRGRALAAWEARYPKVVQKLKENTLLMLNKSHGVYSTVLAQLDEMASARASRNIDQYMAAAKVITTALEKYDVAFREYYTKDVKPWMDKTEVFAEQDAAAESTAPPGITPAVVGVPGVGEGVAGPRPTLEMPPLPGATVPAVPAVTAPVVTAPAVDNGPPTQPNPPVVSPAAQLAQEKAQAGAEAALAQAKKFKQMPKVNKADDAVTAHAKFYRTLETLSGESPAILVNYINKYAKSIQTTDPETSIKLFSISKSIRG